MTNFDRVPTAEFRQRNWRAAALRASTTDAGRLACVQGFVLTHGQAHMAGVASNEVRGLLRRGEWTAPRRRVLCVLPPQGKYVHGRRPEIRAAAVALLRPDTVISHECAALTRGLDVLQVPPVATLATASRAHAAARSGAVVRSTSIDDDEISRWFGVRVTSVARTVVDLARQSARDGIVVADSALRNELVTRDELASSVARHAGIVGVATARRVLALASALSDSALESLIRLFLADHHIPLPDQQVWIKTHRRWYQVDGLWAGHGVILEADGLIKYGDDERRDALVAEKLRQEALERAGYTVIRVTWADIHVEPRATLSRICAVLRRHGLVLQPRPTTFSA